MSVLFSWPTVTLDMRVSFPWRGCSSMLLAVAMTPQSLSGVPHRARGGPWSDPLVVPPVDPWRFAGGPGGRFAADPTGERGLADRPQAPALGGQRGPESHCAVAAQVELTQLVRTVSRLDRRSAPIARLIHLGPPIIPVPTPPRSRPRPVPRARVTPWPTPGPRALAAGAGMGPDTARRAGARRAGARRA